MKYILKHKAILFLCITAFILTLIEIVFDGGYGCINKECGFIVGTNYRDGIWFFAVAASAFKTFPFRMPIFAGANLQGYHFLPNLLTYLFSLLGISMPFMYYKIYAIGFMISLTALSIIFAKRIKNDARFIFFFLFFVFFGMPLTLITSLHYYGFIKNSLLINTFQSTRILESMHFAFSYVILLAIFIFLSKKTINLKEKLIIGFFLFLLFGIKFYVASIAIIIVGLNELLTLIKKKNISQFFLANFIYAAFSITAILIFYNPFSAAKGGSIFVFAPFATVHHMIENESMFYLPRMVLARYFLYAHGISPRLIAIELFSTLLFVVFYFGTRVIGFIYLLKQIVTRKITQFEVVITGGIIMGIILSVLFVQKGDWFNPMQFAVTASFLTNYFAGKFMYEVFNKNRFAGIGIGLIVFVLTFIPNLINLNYLSSPARYVIPQKEMEALEYLKKKPDGTVFYPIVDPTVDLAYIPAFTGKQSYVNFTTVLENTGMPFEKRLKETKDAGAIDVDSLDIRYAYIQSAYIDHEIMYEKFGSSKKYKEIFKNEKTIIFEKI